MDDENSREKVLNVLHIEDSVKDFEITKELLADAGLFMNITRVEKENDLIFCLKKNTYDIILADFKLPGFDGFGALRLCKEICPEVPFICVSGTIGEEKAVELIKLGADDYILKDRLQRLPYAIKCTLEKAKERQERKRIEKKMLENEQIFSCFMEHSPIYLFFKDENIRAIRLSKNYETMLGRPISEILGKNMDDLFPSVLAKSMIANDKKILEEGKVITIEEELNGRIYSTIKFPIEIEGKPLYLAGYTTDITEQKQMENTLKESESSLQLAQKIAKMGNWEFDILNQKNTWSRNCFVLFGLQPYEVDPTYEYFRSRVHPDDLHLIDDGLENIIKNRAPIHIEMRIVMPDRTCKWLQNNIVPIFQEGKLIALKGTDADISELKETQIALEESLEKYKDLTLISPAGIFHTDKNGATTFVNPKWCQISGMPSEEAMGNGWLKAVHPEDKEKIIQGWREATQLKKTSFSEYRFLRSDGSVAWVMGQAIPEKNSAQEIIGYIGTITDITDLKQTYEKLMNSEQRLKDILYSAVDWVWETDQNGVFTYSSEKGFNLFGLNPEDIIGKTPIDLMPEDEAKRVAAIFSKIIKEKAPIKDIENWNITKNGERICLLTNGVPILDKDGNLQGYRGVDKDITEHVKALELLAQSEEKFRKSLEYLPIPVAYSDLKGTISFRNEYFLKIFGYSTIDISTVAEWYSNAYPDPQYREWAVQKWELAVKNAIETGSNIKPEEYDVTCKAGNKRHVIISGIIMNENLLVTFIDITDRKKAEEALKAKANELERFNNLMVGRELKMVELKTEINELLVRLGKKERYKIAGKEDEK